MKLRNKLIGVTLLGAAFGSSALSLGRARGAVVLGQPISLAVEVRVDSLDEATAQCFRADVVHGDVAVDASRVRLIVQPPAAGSQDAVIRIRSSAIVDEPVVGVVLHALCGQRGVRRYDFLPEYPAELLATQVPVVLPGDASIVDSPISRDAAAPMAPSVATEAATPATVVLATRPAAPPRPPVTRSATPRQSAAVSGPATARPERAATAGVVAKPAASAADRPRLQLDAPLRSSPALPGAPADNPTGRAEATATWRALNAEPTDMFDSQRLQALEDQAKAAKLQSEKAERDLRERLARAESRLDETASNRVDIVLLYGLLALLLLTTAAAAYFWRRARKAALEGASWGASPVGVGDGPTGATTLAPTAPVFGGARKEPSTPAAPTAAAPDKRAAVVGQGAAAAVAVAAARSFAPATSVASAAMPAKVELRNVNPEEFFDVQQHADFFMSLGQYDQAIDVLKKHIDEHAEMSPLAYLELLKIYHTLGRQAEFNAMRDAFQRMFNGRIPNFAAFTDEGLGLEDYPATLLSIESAWSSPRVLDTIDANVFRHPEDTGRPLDLAAFRDLLLLHTVASSLLRPAVGASSADAGGRNTWNGGLDEDGSFSPRRLTRPDFTASLTPNLRTDAAKLAPAAGMTSAAVFSSVGSEAAQDSDPVPLSSPNYDHGLILDLDLSAPLEAPVTARYAIRPQELPELPPLPKLDLDLDLGFDLNLESERGDLGPDTEPMPHSEAAEPATSVPAPSAALDSGLIDFDLFDPTTEARIAPKIKR